MGIGTGLSADARDSVAGFLARVIAGHLGADAARPIEAVPAAIPPEAVITTITAGITTAADGGPPSIEGPPVYVSAAEAVPIDPDLLLLALVRRRRQADPHGTSCVHLAPDIPPAMLYAALENYLEVRDDEVLLGIVGAGEGARGEGLRPDDPADLLVGEAGPFTRGPAAAVPVARLERFSVALACSGLLPKHPPVSPLRKGGRIVRTDPFSLPPYEGGDTGG